MANAMAGPADGEWVEFLGFDGIQHESLSEDLWEPLATRTLLVRRTGHRRRDRRRRRGATGRPSPRRDRDVPRRGPRPVPARSHGLPADGGRVHRPGGDRRRTVFSEPERLLGAAPLKINAITVALLDIPGDFTQEYNRWYDLDHLPEHI